MKTLHTPLPWEVITDPEGFEFVADGRGFTIGTMDCSDPDAAFIVRACNSHADLVAALEDSVFQLERFTQVHGDRAARPCLDRARAALAKAKG